MEFTQKEKTDALAMQSRWEKYRKANNSGKYNNWGLGIMSECERNFLLQENAIINRNGVDVINAEKPYAVAYDKGMPQYTELIDNYADVLNIVGSGKKTYVPYKYNLWSISKIFEFKGLLKNLTT
jgi:hypothetical protein